MDEILVILMIALTALNAVMLYRHGVIYVRNRREREEFIKFLEAINTDEYKRLMQ